MSKKIKLEDFKVLKKLGEGQFGLFYLFPITNLTIALP